MEDTNIQLVYGVGVKDVDYIIHRRKTVQSSGLKKKLELVWSCPYYEKWLGMISRCYCSKRLNRSPTYIGCTVDPEWFYLSNFIKWVDSQPNRDWQDCHLDKDLLIEGNKHYSPATCVFISGGLNNFILDGASVRGDYLLGVCKHKASGRFMAQCRNPFKAEVKYIGYFNTELEAHKAWQERKHQYACQLAELQSDSRVSDVLRSKYSSDKDWSTK
jgi:hypothetical protein